MEIKEVKTYQFTELSESAKEKAIQDSCLVNYYFWGDDAIQSLIAWARVIGLEINDYRIDWGNTSQCKIKYDDKYVDYAYDFDLNKDLTGYCIDYVLMQTWNKTKDVDECINAFLKDCKADFEYQLTDEYAEEHFDANDYVFTENGKVFNY